jgi:FkbM family methyltransferase
MALNSQFGQDEFVIELLGRRRGGYFFDVGASNGLDSSNTLRLEREFGWRGLCVEANRRFFRQLERNRGCVCVNACLYDREGTFAFLDKAGTLGGVVDDFHPGQLDIAMRIRRLARDAQGRPPTAEVRTVTIEHVLEAAGAPPVIDYWSLDVEGAELRLLQSFPFGRWTFDALTVEHNNVPAARRAIREFLESRGYRFAGAIAIDDCYVREGALPARRSRSAVWRRGL